MMFVSSGSTPKPVASAAWTAFMIAVSSASEYALRTWMQMLGMTISCVLALALTYRCRWRSLRE
jgi:hypothetical protein